MDRMIHTALNTLNNLYMNRAVKSQNLSNLNVPGFRRDMGTTFSSGFLTEDKRYADGFGKSLSVGYFAIWLGVVSWLDYKTMAEESADVKLAPNTSLNDTSLLAWAPL